MKSDVTIRWLNIYIHFCRYSDYFYTIEISVYIQLMCVVKQHFYTHEVAMTTASALSAEEAHVIKSKATKWTLCFCQLLFPRSRTKCFKNDLSCWKFSNSELRLTDVSLQDDSEVQLMWIKRFISVRSRFILCSLLSLIDVYSVFALQCLSKLCQQTSLLSIVQQRVPVN